MTTTDTIPTIEREIKYSRQDRDYACYVNGQYIGSRANYSDGEALCNQVAYDLLMDGQCATATELDGGSEPDAMAADHAVVAPVCMCGEPATLIIHDGDTDIASCERCYEIEYDDNEARISSWTTDPIADHVTACYVCGSAAWEHNVHGPLCPSHAAAYSEWQDETNSPILATALLAEADRALSTCPGAFGPCSAEADAGYAAGYAADAGADADAGSGYVAGIGAADAADAAADAAAGYAADAAADAAAGGDAAPMTPRALRVNLPRDEVRGLLEDIDAWQQATQARLTFSGVLHGPYACLYLSLADGSVPQALIALCVRAVRVVRGSAAVCGAWLVRMEPGRVLSEYEIREVA